MAEIHKTHRIGLCRRAKRVFDPTSRSLQLLFCKWQWPVPWDNCWLLVSNQPNHPGQVYPLTKGLYQAIALRQFLAGGQLLALHG